MAGIEISGLSDAIGRANAQVAKSSDPLANIATYGKELYAGGVTNIGAVAGAITGKNYVKWTGDTIGDYWKAVTGDEKAMESTVETSAGKKKLGDIPGTHLAEDVMNTIEGLGKAAALGLLSEAWNRTTGVFSNPVSSVANTISQVENITNAKDI